MRPTRTTPGTCTIALVALLCAAGLPALGADGPGAAASVPPARVESTSFIPEACLDSPLGPDSVPGKAEELLAEAQRDPAALGPLSIGTPDAGLLLNPVPFPEGEFWRLRDPRESWGTDETIAYVITAIESVEARYPGSPRLVIGDVSNPKGGRLKRHRSHQAGRDADIGFYYRRGEVDSFLVARRKDLDLRRNWAFVRALLTETDVDRIFVDRSVMSLLYAEALEEGEDRGWLDDVFGRTAEKGIVQHVRRHKDHFHVRFYNPRAQEQGRIVYPVLVETGAAPPPTVTHRVRPGETLGGLARRYGTSVSAIRAANGIRGTRLRAGRSYTIPVRRVPPDEGPVVVPPRRAPPLPATTASAVEAPSAAPADGTAATAPR
jgi:murein endopeptidase